jgi:uridylate kinase
MTAPQLLAPVASMEMTAGANNIFDMLGAQIVKRSHIPMQVINGNDPHNIIAVVEGKQIGTRIE